MIISEFKESPRYKYYILQETDGLTEREIVDFINIAKPAPISSIRDLLSINERYNLLIEYDTFKREVVATYNRMDHVNYFNRKKIDERNKITYKNIRKLNICIYNDVIKIGDDSKKYSLHFITTQGNKDVIKDIIKEVRLNNKNVRFEAFNEFFIEADEIKSFSLEESEYNSHFMGLLNYICDNDLGDVRVGSLVKNCNIWVTFLSWRGSISFAR